MDRRSFERIQEDRDAACVSIALLIAIAVIVIGCIL